LVLGGAAHFSLFQNFSKLKGQYLVAAAVSHPPLFTTVCYQYSGAGFSTEVVANLSLMPGLSPA